MRSKNLVLITALFLMLTALWSGPALAEIKVIETDSSYLMGDNDSKVIGRRIAVQEAKQKALELAGTYVESLTVVRNYQLTKDDVKAYTAGVLETEVISEQMRGTAERPEMTIKTRCRIDTDVLTAQISRFRENEDLKEQLDATVKENDGLKKERDALVQQLATGKSTTQADETRKKLDAVLAKEESNDETTRIWAAFAPSLAEGEDNGPNLKRADLEKAAARLEQTVKVHPQNLRAYCLLAMIYQKMGDDAAAEKQMRTAIEHLPSAPAPHLRLGILLRARGKHLEAMKEFHFVERMRPRNLPVVFYSGMTFKDMGKCGKAVQYLNRFLKAKQADLHPKLKELAFAAIEQCGGNRPGRQRKVRQS